VRVVYHAKLVEHFADAGDCVHVFTGDIDDGGEWITPADALNAIGFSIWNAIEHMSEVTADRFELGLGLSFVDSRATSPEAMPKNRETVS
jgi:hypothetical protein